MGKAKHNFNAIKKIGNLAYMITGSMLKSKYSTLAEMFIKGLTFCKLLKNIWQQTQKKNNKIPHIIKKPSMSMEQTTTNDT